MIKETSPKILKVLWVSEQTHERIKSLAKKKGMTIDGLIRFLLSKKSE